MCSPLPELRDWAKVPVGNLFVFVRFPLTWAKSRLSFSITALWALPGQTFLRYSGITIVPVRRCNENGQVYTLGGMLYFLLLPKLMVGGR